MREMRRLRKLAGSGASWLREQVPPLAWLALSAVAGILIAQVASDSFKPSVDQGLSFWATALLISGAIYHSAQRQRNPGRSGSGYLRLSLRGLDREHGANPPPTGSSRGTEIPGRSHRHRDGRTPEAGKPIGSISTPGKIYDRKHRPDHMRRANPRDRFPCG